MFYLSKDLYVVLRDRDFDQITEEDLEIYNDYDEACAEAERLTFLEVDAWEKKNPDSPSEWRPFYLQYHVYAIHEVVSSRIHQVEESAYDSGYDSGSNSGYENGYDEGFKEGKGSTDEAYDDGYQQGLQDGKQQSGTE